MYTLPTELVSEILRISGNPSAIRRVCKPFREYHRSCVTELDLDVGRGDEAAATEYVYRHAQLRKMSWTRTPTDGVQRTDFVEGVVSDPFDFDFSGLAKLVDLRICFPGPTRFTSSAWLASLTSLTSLCLRWIDVDFRLDAPCLKSLTLTSCKCRFLPDIWKLTTLTFLDLEDTLGASMCEVLPGIGTLASLAHLSLSERVRYSNDVLVPLTGLTGLTCLTLSKHGRRERAVRMPLVPNVAPLFGLPSLSHLKVEALFQLESSCLEQSVAWIAALTTLTSLDMSGCMSVGQSALAMLTLLPRLSKINVSRCRAVYGALDWTYLTAFPSLTEIVADPFWHLEPARAGVVAQLSAKVALTVAT